MVIYKNNQNDFLKDRNNILEDLDQYIELIKYGIYR